MKENCVIGLGLKIITNVFLKNLWFNMGRIIS
jgi:hypothetical protein